MTIKVSEACNLPSVVMTGHKAMARGL